MVPPRDRQGPSAKRQSPQRKAKPSRAKAGDARVRASRSAPEESVRYEISLATLGHAGDFGSLAHYADPAYYDLAYRKRRHDVDYYVGLARACQDRRVLEFGCGNGRITVPMAQSGSTVTAVDLSKPMLLDFEKLASKLPAKVRERIRLHHADMRQFQDGQTYSLVIAPFNTVLHLYEPEELLAFLARVREHLAPDGEFVFDVSLPQPADLCHDPSEPLHSPDFTHPATGEVFSYSERFEYDPIRQLLVVWMQFTAKDGSESFTIPLAHRQYYPQELRGLLGCAGFGRIEFRSDFSAEPPGPHTDSLVIHCRL